MAPSLEISQALNQLLSNRCWTEVSYAQQLVQLLRSLKLEFRYLDYT